MLLQIKNVIDAEQLMVIRGALDSASFIDGASTAGKQAAKVKLNSEIEQNSELGQKLAKIIVGNLYANQQFKDACLPHKIAQPIFSRYQKGMEYGEHIDDPVMGDHARLRCDVAMTLFLNEPTEYEGGELSIRTNFGKQEIKLNAGDLVLYPASSLHAVNEIKSGFRQVAVTWVQSMIADPSQRELLYDLSQARNELLFGEHTINDRVIKQVDHSYTNLVRMWSQV